MAKRCSHPFILAFFLAASSASLAFAAPPRSPAPRAGAQRNGSHDFDWDIGTWRTHQRRLLHPLTGSQQWVDYHGTDVVRKLWNGANTGMIEANGPAGHLEIFTIRLYNPQSHQWTVSFANPASGTMRQTLAGEFR